MIKKEQWEKALETLRLGGSVTDACTMAGISRESFYDKCRRDREWNQAAEMAILRPKVRAAALVQKAAQTHWQAAAWWLERKYPEQYAERYRHEADIKFANTLLALVSRALQKNLPEMCPHCRTNLDLPEKVSTELLALSRRVSEDMT